MERMSGEGKVVCVTGASGYIALWLVKHLLLRGYIVKATVRDPNDPKKTKHLIELDGAKERLHLFKADLLKEGAFDSVVDGCDGVFHTASPVLFKSSNPQAEIIDPAVKGTINVLKSCADVRTIKRVIVTSSMAAVVFNERPVTPVVVIDETWFSDPKIFKETRSWYSVSKTLAEEAAWNFAKEYAVDVVVMNPTYVIGPLLQPILNESVQQIVEVVKGGETYPDSYYSSIDVRDVADAHIQAFEIPSASGRYCLAANINHFSEILKIAHEHFPALQLPEKCQGGKFSLPYHKISQEKAKTLDINFIPLEVTLKDTIESLKKKGFISIRDGLCYVTELYADFISFRSRVVFFFPE